MKEQVFILQKGERDLSRLVGFVSALPRDKAYKVTVCEKRNKRSDSQNRYLWGVCYKIICDHLEGWEADDVHEFFLGSHFGWETIEGLGKKRLKPLRRSSKLTTIEFMDYVAFIQRFMAERGVDIPSPNEY